MLRNRFVIFYLYIQRMVINKNSSGSLVFNLFFSGRMINASYEIY